MKDEASVTNPLDNETDLRAQAVTTHAGSQLEVSGLQRGKLGPFGSTIQVHGIKHTRAFAELGA